MKNPTLPCKRTALLAEIDCNRFTYYWLKKEGVVIPKDFRYSYYSTMAYNIHEFINKANKNKNNS